MSYTWSITDPSRYHDKIVMIKNFDWYLTEMRNAFYDKCHNDLLQ